MYALLEKLNKLEFTNFPILTNPYKKKNIEINIIKKKIKKLPELKGNNSNDKIRQEVLGRLAKTKAKVTATKYDTRDILEAEFTISHIPPK